MILSKNYIRKHILKIFWPSETVKTHHKKVEDKT